ncbi:uncharacterized protein LOC143475035 [Brachyhypopomus gauderio]|uniref:uncharacterized protein LOC143475035 n=1 Tax=Brachyhypopomus gauderio TaxID=698409 RepID=UPI004042D568
MFGCVVARRQTCLAVWLPGDRHVWLCGCQETDMFGCVVVAPGRVLLVQGLRVRVTSALRSRASQYFYGLDTAAADTTLPLWQEDRRKPVRMKVAALVILTSLVCCVLTGPVHRLQWMLQTSQPGLQSEPMERLLDKTQSSRSPSERPRVQRAVSVPNVPNRFCSGCYSIIGDPTRPQLNVYY